jgi:hypothetical protein
MIFGDIRSSASEYSSNKDCAVCICSILGCSYYPLQITCNLRVRNVYAAGCCGTCIHTFLEIDVVYGATDSQITTLNTISGVQ